jgi:hypothetical protein
MMVPVAVLVAVMMMMVMMNAHADANRTDMHADHGSGGRTSTRQKAKRENGSSNLLHCNPSLIASGWTLDTLKRR